MGGLAVDVSDIDDRLHSVTLTPAGLKFLAERGHFIEVTDGDIRDKSKADIFAKCLVILQVTWIALQTISRKATGYPLSPLEIHTLVHAACASVMYILWFQKPLDVRAPTIVSKAGFEDLTALMLMQTPRLGRTWYSHLDPPKDFMPVESAPRSEASFLMFDGTALSQRNEGCSSCGGHSTLSTTMNTELADKNVLHAIPDNCDGRVSLASSGRQQAITSEARTLSSPTTPHPPAGIRCGPPPGVKAVCDLRSGDFTPSGIGLQPLMTKASYHDEYVPLPSLCWFLRYLHPRPPKPALPAQISPALKERLPPLSVRSPAYRHEINLSLSEKDLKRWKLAGAAYVKEMKIQQIGFGPSKRYWNLGIAQSRKSGELTHNKRPTKLLARRCRNVNKKLWDEGEERMLLTLWSLGSLYGGIHLALWNYDFPTHVECLMWRISAATLASAPVILVLLALLAVTEDVLTKWCRKIFLGNGGLTLSKRFKAVVDFAMEMIFASTSVLPVPLYIFARIFIVVESFISLRHVPIGVYEGGLGWSKYIPHL